MQSMHSVSVENLNLSQVEDSNTQIYTIHNYLAEKYPVLIHLWETAQQYNKTGNTPALFQDWKLFSNVLIQGIHQQCFKIGKSSAM